MPKLPQISGKALVKVLLRLGYEAASQKGSHIRMSHPDKFSITIPNHKLIGKGLLRKIIRDMDISVEEFIKIIKK